MRPLSYSLTVRDDVDVGGVTPMSTRVVVDTVPRVWTRDLVDDIDMRTLSSGPRVRNGFGPVFRPPFSP